MGGMGNGAAPRNDCRPPMMSLRRTLLELQPLPCFLAKGCVTKRSLRERTARATVKRSNYLEKLTHFYCQEFSREVGTVAHATRGHVPITDGSVPSVPTSS